jgi:Zn-finger protein
MKTSHNEKFSESSNTLQIWYCEHCRQVHFKAPNVMLDFTRREFVKLTDAVLEILQNEFDPLELSELTNKNFAGDDDREVLSSEIVS